jgi:FK506-binding protein 1
MPVDIEVFVAGDGVTFPQRGDRVVIHYVGMFEDGTEFDSSRARGRPLQFDIGLGKVISGWDNGISRV